EAAIAFTADPSTKRALEDVQATFSKAAVREVSVDPMLLSQRHELFDHFEKQGALTAQVVPKSQLNEWYTVPANQAKSWYSVSLPHGKTAADAPYIELTTYSVHGIGPASWWSEESLKVTVDRAGTVHVTDPNDQQISFPTMEEFQRDHLNALFSAGVVEGRFNAVNREKIDQRAAIESHFQSLPLVASYSDADDAIGDCIRALGEEANNKYLLYRDGDELIVLYKKPNSSVVEDLHLKATAAGFQKDGKAERNFRVLLPELSPLLPYEAKRAAELCAVLSIVKYVDAFQPRNPFERLQEISTALGDKSYGAYAFSYNHNKTGAQCIHLHYITKNGGVAGPIEIALASESLNLIIQTMGSKQKSRDEIELIVAEALKTIAEHQTGIGTLTQTFKEIAKKHHDALAEIEVMKAQQKATQKPAPAPISAPLHQELESPGDFLKRHSAAAAAQSQPMTQKTEGVKKQPGPPKPPQGVVAYAPVKNKLYTQGRRMAQLTHWEKSLPIGPISKEKALDLLAYGLNTSDPKEMVKEAESLLNPHLRLVDRGLGARHPKDPKTLGISKSDQKGSTWSSIYELLERLMIAAGLWEKKK
ncbi:MAG TPA: hypothetical protein VN457_01525, partial [Chlamydiales bacterium]|nr:hypothetical protein [Chlamydiales bacterium]